MIYEFFECSTNIPSSEDARFFHEFTGKINHSWLTIQVTLQHNNSTFLLQQKARVPISQLGNWNWWIEKLQPVFVISNPIVHFPPINVYCEVIDINWKKIKRELNMLAWQQISSDSYSVGSNRTVISNFSLTMKSQNNITARCSIRFASELLLLQCENLKPTRLYMFCGAATSVDIWGRITIPSLTCKQRQFTREKP